MDLDDAIEQRREIEFAYEGLPRIVQPAAHGIHKTTGNEILRGYQVGGASSSRPLPDWRIYLVSKIQSLVVSERTFLNEPPDYKSDDSAMQTIFSQL